MWGNSYPKAGLRRTCETSTSAIRPSAPISNPCGVFIQELAAITEAAPPIPEITIGIPLQKWAQPGSRSQP